jgi:alpha/beta superfamily hydrolase
MEIPAGPHGIVYGHQAGFVEQGKTLQFDLRQIGAAAGMFVNNAV